ncbi:hypothetical protein O9929_17415 [Vibrio lentus]|nr:hypothetical protein [Vibrio lentus]
MGGNNARYVGQDMSIKQLNDGWETKGNNGRTSGDAL